MTVPVTRSKRRHQSRRAQIRLRRTVLSVGATVTLTGIALASGPSGRSTKHQAKSTVPPRLSPTPAPTITATPARWSLPVPLSRSVVLTDGRNLIVFGGLTPRHRTVNTVMQVNPTTGAHQQVRALASPT